MKFIVGKTYSGQTFTLYKGKTGNEKGRIACKLQTNKSGRNYDTHIEVNVNGEWVFQDGSPIFQCLKAK